MHSGQSSSSSSWAAFDLVLLLLEERVRTARRTRRGPGPTRRLPSAMSSSSSSILRGEADVDDLREVLDQQVGRRPSPTSSGKNRRSSRRTYARSSSVADGRGVRGRPADAVLLERLDQRRLGEPRRRLGEVLLGQDLEQPQDLLRGERRERCASASSSTAVSSRPSKYTRRNPSNFRVWPVARSRYAGASARGGRDVHRHLVEQRLGHLRRHGPLPDQPVQAGLVPVEHAARARPAGARPRVGRMASCASCAPRCFFL